MNIGELVRLEGEWCEVVGNGERNLGKLSRGNRGARWKKLGESGCLATHVIEISFLGIFQFYCSKCELLNPLDLIFICERVLWL